MSVFNLNASDNLTAKMFFDPNGSVSVARYDQVKYPELEHLTTKQLGWFWRPEEIDLNTDRGDFKKLSAHERHIFTSNLKRQILLDSVQGRAPSMVFAPVTALPEMETWAQTWTFFETIHSRTYTHIIRNIYAKPGEVFDTMKDNPKIVECADEISHYYDDFYYSSLAWQLAARDRAPFTGSEGSLDVLGRRTYTLNAKELKKKLWLVLNSVNILEGIRFYVSFACSWAFAENSRMEGNAKLIKLIARDENLHLGATQQLIRSILPNDDEDFAELKNSCEDQVRMMFRLAMEQEKMWARYLFKDGSMIGLNEALLCEYVDYIGSQRMKALGLTPDFKAPVRDPLPWTASWINSKTVQVAPQETEITSYINGGVKQDVASGDFSDFDL